jgi:hypothetical protein
MTGRLQGVNGPTSINGLDGLGHSGGLHGIGGLDGANGLGGAATGSTSVSGDMSISAPPMADFFCMGAPLDSFALMPDMFSMPPPIAYGSFDQPLDPTHFAPANGSHMFASGGAPPSAAQFGRHQQQQQPSFGGMYKDMAPLASAATMPFDMGTGHAAVPGSHTMAHPLTASTWPVQGYTPTIGCGCGPSCMCEGCIDHPYNKTNTDLVMASWASQQQDFEAKYGALGHLPSDKAQHQLQKAPTAATTATSTTTLGTPGLGANSNNSQPPSPTTPVSEEGSVGDQTLHESDFVWVRFPLPGMCRGRGASSCECGNDCM